MVGYEVSKLTAYVAKRLLKTKYASLPNILAQEALIPELIQDNFTKENIAKAMMQYLGNEAAFDEVVERFNQFHTELSQDSDQKVVDEIGKLIAHRVRFL